jgi:glycosyltransferase involved in cell wall biosynthesis
LTGVSDTSIYRFIQNKGNFVLMDYVDRSLLNTLHQSAFALIYPSLAEGFGYPAVESMKYGVPVAASGLTAIPEVCEDAALYFNPLDVSEIANRILQLLNPKIYTEYSEKSLKQYQKVAERQKEDLEKLVDFILGENQ